MIKTIGYENFLPIYPSINEDFFQQKILDKKEFYDLRLEKKLEKIQLGDFLNHQKIIQRFLSEYTMYDELLLYHSVGTGKSGVAFGVTEKLFSSTSFARVFILTRSPELLDSLMKQLVYRFSSRYDVPREVMNSDKELRYIRKMTSDFYTFRTFQTFADELASTPDEILFNKYNNSIYILDEVHNIKADQDAKVYKQFHRLFHLIKNRKVLLMTGTPMRNEVYDISYLMNLILPQDKQLPVGVSFNDRFISGVDVVDQTLLKKYLKGRISILLPPEDTGVNVVYMGNFNTEPIIEKFRLYTTNMSTFQYKYYSEAYLRDTGVENTIYTNSRQANLFVFPDGSYGQEGLVKYMNKTQLTDKLKDEINTIDKLKKYSGKYAAIIENILDPRNENKKIYIYCSIVNGSGINLFTKILELYGYRSSRGTEKEKGKRYIALTSETGSIDKLLGYFNTKRNKFGDYCKVIIGSRKISEGFTFKDIQVIHIATLHWNDTEIQQAKARAIRYKAFDNLLEKGIVPTVRIFQHGLIHTQDKNVRSIDIQMMDISKRKDLLIRKMDRIIKEISFDCPLVYERNRRNGKNGSSECDYQDCNYFCDESKFEPDTIDMSTYQLYYYSDDDVINGIVNLFGKYFSLSIDTIKDLLLVDYFQLLRSLYTIIYGNIPIINKYGIVSYLREHKNEYYIVDNISLSNNHSEMSIYTKQPFVVNKNSLSDILNRKGFIHKLNSIRNISQSTTEEDVKKYILGIPLDIQELFLETALELKYIRNKDTPIINWIESIYKEHIKTDDKYLMISTLLQPNIRCLDKKSKEWIDCIPVFNDEEEKEDKINELENNPYGYYGIIEDNRFCIKDVRDKNLTDDDRKKKTGANCLQVQFNKDRLVEVCIHLGIEVPPEYRPVDVRKNLMKTKAGRKLLENWNDWTNEQLSIGYYWVSKSKIEICGIIKDWFERNGLLVSGTCGKAGKLKN